MQVEHARSTANLLSILTTELLNYIVFAINFRSFPGGSAGKESASNAGETGRREFNPGVRKIPSRRKWQPTPVFLPRKSHGQRSLTTKSLWGRKE